MRRESPLQVTSPPCESSPFTEYGDKLNEMLRDRLVCGVNHKGIQRKLLAQEKLTYENAYALALSVEVSEKDAVKLQNSRPVPTCPLPTVPMNPSASEEKVHYSASWKPRKGATVMCYCCGGAHLATQCKHKDVTCYSCKKKGSGLPIKTTIAVAPEAKKHWENGQKHPLHG